MHYLVFRKSIIINSVVLGANAVLTICALLRIDFL